MAGRSTVSRLDELKSKKELQLIQDGFALTQGLEAMHVWQTMREARVIGFKEMIAWFVPITRFRPGALTISEMMASTNEDRAFKIALAFLLAMVSQPAAGRVSGRLSMAHFSTSPKSVDSRGVKKNGDTADSYNRFKTVVIWMTSDQVDANEGVRKAAQQHQKLTESEAMRRYPPKWAPAPLRRDNVVGALFISVIRDPEASYLRALDMTIRENQFLRGFAGISDRGYSVVRSMCENVAKEGSRCGYSDAELFSMLFSPQHHRAAAIDDAIAEIQRRVDLKATEKYQKWLQQQQARADALADNPDAEPIDLSAATLATKLNEFKRGVRARMDLKTVPQWQLLIELGYAPESRVDPGELPESVRSSQRLVRDALVAKTARPLPDHVEIRENKPGLNPAETGAHARAYIASYTDFVGLVFPLFGIEPSDAQRHAAMHFDVTMTNYGDDPPSILNPAEFITLSNALERAKACGAASGICALSNFVDNSGVSYTAAVQREYVKQPLVGPFRTERVRMTRRGNSNLDEPTNVDEVATVAEGVHQIADSAGPFSLKLPWALHTSKLPQDRELFEKNESAQFPHTVDNYPDRLRAAIDTATARIANVTQGRVDDMQDRILRYLDRAYNMLVRGRADDAITLDPVSVQDYHEQTIFLRFRDMLQDRRSLSVDEFFSTFGPMLNTSAELLKQALNAYQKKGVPSKKQPADAHGKSNVPTAARTADLIANRSVLESEQWFKRLRKQRAFAKLQALSRNESNGVAGEEGRIMRAATHDLYYELLPLVEGARLLMTIDPAQWRLMLPAQRQYCCDQFARVYYSGVVANGIALRATLKWENSCYTGVSLNDTMLGTGMSRFALFVATGIAFNSSVAGIINGPQHALDLLMYRGNSFRIATKLGLHTIIAGPAALGKSSAADMANDLSIPNTRHGGGAASAKANKDLGALKFAFSTRVIDEPSKTLTHGTRQGTDERADTEFNDLKRLLGDGQIVYDRSVHGQGTERVIIQVHINFWVTSNELLVPRENSLSSRQRAILCDSGDRQGRHNTLIVRILQPPNIKATTAISALRARWRHHHHFVALMTQISDCGGCVPPNTMLLSVLSNKVLQRVGALIPGASNYPRVAIMAVSKAVQLCFTRAFYMYCQISDNQVGGQWREGVDISEVDNAMESDGNNNNNNSAGDNDDDDQEYDQCRDKSSRVPKNPYETGVDWVSTVGNDANHMRRHFDISIINKMSPHALLTSEMAMFVLTQMMDELFPVHLHAVLFTLSVARGGWNPTAMDCILGSENRDCDMSMFVDDSSAVARVGLEQKQYKIPGIDKPFFSEALPTFGRSKAAYGRERMPLFWVTEEEYERKTLETYGHNKDSSINSVSFPVSDNFVDPNYVEFSYHQNSSASFLHSAMTNTQNPTDQAIRYILSYCAYGFSNIRVPMLSRIYKGGLKEGILTTSDLKFETQPAPSNLQCNEVVMHHIPAVQVIGGGSDRKMRVSTMFLLLGAERFRIMNMYAMLEDNFTPNGTRMIIPRTVPGQCNLFQTIVLNNRPSMHFTTVHPMADDGASHTCGGVIGMSMPVNVPVTLPEGITIRAALAPIVISSITETARRTISERVGVWKNVEPMMRGETQTEYEQRNSLILARDPRIALSFGVRSLEDDCALAHLQLNAFTFEEAERYLPSTTERAMNGRQALIGAFDSTSLFTQGDANSGTYDDSREVTIGEGDDKITMTTERMRAMRGWLAATGKLIYPDHYANAQPQLDSINAEVSDTTMTDMIIRRNREKPVQIEARKSPLEAAATGAASGLTLSGGPGVKRRGVTTAAMSAPGAEHDGDEGGDSDEDEGDDPSDDGGDFDEEDEMMV